MVHDPPIALSLRVTTDPVHRTFEPVTIPAPEIDDILIVAVAIADPQELVTV